MQVVELPAPVLQVLLALLTAGVFGYAKMVNNRLDRLEQSDRDKHARVTRLEGRQ